VPHPFAVSAEGAVVDFSSVPSVPKQRKIVPWPKSKGTDYDTSRRFSAPRSRSRSSAVYSSSTPGPSSRFRSGL